MNKVLVVSVNPVDFNITGPSIRNLEIARYLALFHKVTLAIPNKTALKEDNIEIVTYNGKLLKRLFSPLMLYHPRKSK